jgi:hypothetical protein
MNMADRYTNVRKRARQAAVLASAASGAASRRDGDWNLYVNANVAAET